ncbi:MAG TPA: NAD(P)/FAD-dependent oxidoreductase [Nitrospiria bacterium]
MSNQADILIVGAGVGGLVLALALGRKGFRVCVIDAQSVLSNPLRGEIIQPNGLRVLEDLGLLKEIETQDVHKNHLFHFYNTDGYPLLSIDYRLLPEPFNYSLIVLPKVIHDVLLKEISRLDRIDLCLGVRLKGMVRNGNSWKVTGSQKDRVVEWDARLVVGGDGVFSKVREFAGISCRYHRYKDAYLTMMIRRPRGFKGEGRYYIGRKKILALFPVSEKQLYLFYLIPLKKREVFQSKGIQYLHHSILSIDPSVQEFLLQVNDWDQIGIMPCSRLHASSWVEKGVALIGDSAHAMNPHVAQGRNQAMEDALVLFQVIQDCFEKGDFSKKALQSYERFRRPQTECLQRLGDELNLVWNSGFPPMVWLRERIFRKIQGNPDLLYKTLATVAGIHSKRYSFMDRLKVLGVIPS